MRILDKTEEEEKSLWIQMVPLLLWAKSRTEYVVYEKKISEFTSVKLWSCVESWSLVVFSIYIYIYIYIYIVYLWIHESIESFENSRMQYNAYKRLIRNSEQGPAPGPQSQHANYDICGKLCLSLAGLKSNLRKCAKSILHPNNVTVKKTERLCKFCGKICRSLAGLKSHLRTHTI